MITAIFKNLRILVLEPWRNRWRRWGFQHYGINLLLQLIWCAFLLRSLRGVPVVFHVWKSTVLKSICSIFGFSNCSISISLSCSYQCTMLCDCFPQIHQFLDVGNSNYQSGWVARMYWLHRWLCSRTISTPTCSDFWFNRPACAEPRFCCLD